MKIEIIKSNHPDYWYSDMIGKQFEVIEFRGCNQFKVKRDIGDNWFVHSMDTKIIG